MTTLKQPPQAAEAAPHNGAHTWRISLNLTRRIVRRMMELHTATIASPAPKPATQVPAAHDFRASVRLLSRTIRRMIDQHQLLVLQPA